MLLFIQSIFVYGLIILAMMHAGKYAYEHQYPDGFLGNDIYAKEKTSFLDIITKSHFIIPILVFCLFAALRFNVGVDCESYRDDFYDLLQKGKTDREDYELGYLLTIKFSLLFTNTSYLFFALLSFFQISLLYYAMRKESYLLMFFGITIILSETFHYLMNGVRQNIAACIFVAMIPLILNKKYWIWIVPTMFTATLFHKSAIIILALSVIGYYCKEKLLNPLIQLIIVAVCFLLMDKIDNLLLQPLYDLGSYAGYEEGAIENYADYESFNKNFGLRSSLYLLIYIIIILYSNKMKEFFNSEKFNTIYNLFFIGICLFLLFYNNFTINRILYYCKIFIPIVEAYFLSYLWLNRDKDKKNITIFAISIALLSIAFSYYLYTGYIDYPDESVLYKFYI